MLKNWTNTFGCCMVHKKDVNIFQKFPEVCSWDVMNGINSERRALMIGLCYNSNFQSIPHALAFMPNIRRCYFQWLAHNAVPMLHTADTTNKIELMPFDEDENEISAFTNVPQL